MSVYEHYKRCVEAKKTIKYEELIPFKEKDTYWETTLNPLFDEAGAVYRIIGTSLNITKRKENEASLLKQYNRYENIIESTNIGTWEWDIDSGNVFCE